MWRIGLAVGLASWSRSRAPLVDDDGIWSYTFALIGGRFFEVRIR